MVFLLPICQLIINFQDSFPMYFYNAELFNIFNTALRLIPAGCREKRDAIKFLDLRQHQEITVSEKYQ